MNKEEYSKMIMFICVSMFLLVLIGLLGEKPKNYELQEENDYFKDKYHLEVQENELLTQELEFIDDECIEVRYVVNEEFYDDMEDSIEIVVYFYENDLDELHNLESWIELNYPTLYDRIMEYEKDYR